MNAGLGNLGVSVANSGAARHYGRCTGWLGGEPSWLLKATAGAALAAERGLHLGTVHYRVSICGVVRYERPATARLVRRAVGIFQRKHNWIMCWLYTGTFGSFIGYSAGFHSRQDSVSRDRRAALRVSRPLIGPIARICGVGFRCGGGRVTLWCSAAWRSTCSASSISARKLRRLFRDVLVPSRAASATHRHSNDPRHHAQEVDRDARATEAERSPRPKRVPPLLDLRRYCGLLPLHPQGLRRHRADRWA